MPSSRMLEFGFFRRLATLACDNPQRSWLARRGSLLTDDDTSLPEEDGHISVDCCLKRNLQPTFKQIPDAVFCHL